MKSIFLSLLFLSCSKSSFRNVEIPVEKERITSGIVRDASSYSPEIDVLVAFLWPQTITTDEQRRAITRVISNSRKLKREKETYLGKKLELSLLYKENHCACVLEARCEEGETGDELKCEEIDAKISENNQTLAIFYELVENVKEDVLASGGEWLATNTDFPLLPLSKFSFSERTINLTVFGAEGEIPLSYKIEDIQVTEERDHQRVAFSFPRMEGGTWFVDVGVMPSQSTLTFQGELTREHEGVTQQGVIYWENPRALLEE